MVDHSASPLAQAKFRLSAEKLVEAIDHMADGTLIVDAEGAITYASAQLAQWFGYEPEELVGRSVEVLVPLGRRADHRRARERYNRDPVLRPMGGSLDIVGARKDGAALLLDVWLAPLDAGLVLVNVRDVTATRQLRASQDTVIQSLFGIAAGLQALAMTTTEPAISARLEQNIALIDDTIVAVRDRLTARDHVFGDGVDS